MLWQHPEPTGRIGLVFAGRSSISPGVAQPAHKQIANINDTNPFQVFDIRVEPIPYF
jgi:hypothetical protein